jgi:hypothetical protein
MTTTHLRFPDESTGMAALDAAGFIATNENGDTVVLTASHTHALDVIGPIYRGGTYDPGTGEVLTPPVLLNGWHVNYVGDIPDGWDAYLVEPKHPSRVFA